MFDRGKKFRAPEKKELSFANYRSSVVALSLLGVTIAGCGGSSEATQAPNQQVEQVGGSRFPQQDLEDGPSRAGIDPETGRIQNIHLLSEQVTEASAAAEQHLYQVMGRAREDVRANYDLTERAITFWRGNVTYDYYDAEKDLSVNILFENPMELYIEDKLYLAAVHPDTQKIITLELGDYDAEAGRTEWTNYPDTFAYSTQEDPFSGQLSVAEITEFDRDGIELADIYASCLRGDRERLYPRAHIWASSLPSSQSNDDYGTYKEQLIRGLDDDKIFSDLNAVRGLVADSTQCLH